MTRKILSLNVKRTKVAKQVDEVVNEVEIAIFISALLVDKFSRRFFLTTLRKYSVENHTRRLCNIGKCN